jgi:hypothetical protein
MMQEKHVFGPFAHGAPDDFTRADLEFIDVDHFAPSYVARVFFNDPDVDHESGTREHGAYAGEMAVFGHPICHGDEGHCMIPPVARIYDHRPSHHLTPAFKRVIVTDALRKALEAGDELTITILISYDPQFDGRRFGHAAKHGHAGHEQQVFNIGSLRLLTYR